MKNIIVITVSLLLIAGCANLGVRPAIDQPCNIYEQVGATPENSVIAARIANPCVVQKGLIVIVQSPIIWASKNYVEQFDAWADKVKMLIETGVSLSDLQTLVLMKVAEFNREAGLTMLILSNNFLVFKDVTDDTGEIDKTLLLMSINDLIAQVHKLALIGGL